MAKKNVCIVGGGATGVALLWALAQDPNARSEWSITLIHDQATVGGHSLTMQVAWDGKNFSPYDPKKKPAPLKIFPVDIGVQFISPMMYPSVHVMLQKPEFQARVPMNNYDALKIASAFPRLNGQPMNWGNFSEYQPGNNNPNSANFAMYNADVRTDIQTFQDYVEVSIAEKDWRNETLAHYFGREGGVYRNSQYFQLYILAPYLSIINGYGNALMNDTNFMDMWPLFANMYLPELWNFPTPLGSFSQPGTGWQRFANGAQSWVQAMLDVAKTFTSDITVIYDSQVDAVATDQSTGQINVTWHQIGSKPFLSRTFDKVVLTTDMWTNSLLLNNPDNQYYWHKLYKTYIGYGKDQKTDKPLGSPIVWDLLWGKCYIHTDSTMLSPDLMQQDETLQFNAWYAPYSNNPDGSNYDLSKTFTTYIQKNVLNDPDADGLYLTMYGYIPDHYPGQKMPDPTKVLFKEPWTHGRWVPSAMGNTKTNLHMAQGLGGISYPGQMNTNVYFAGNNTVIDSEDGALMSALAIAAYAFGVEYPLTDESLPETLFAFTMFNTFYRDVMFPKTGTTKPSSVSQKVVALVTDLESLLKKRSSSPAAIRMAAVASEPVKKKSPAKKKAAGKKAKKAKAVKKAARKPIRKPAKKVAAKKSKAANKRKPVRRTARKPVRKMAAKKRKPAKRKVKKPVRKVAKKKKTTRRAAKSKRKIRSRRSKR